MTGICVTRHMKNARHLQATAPQLLPREEPADGFASRIPPDLLGGFHVASSADVQRRHPQLAEALRRSPAPRPRPRASAPLFSGSIVFVQASFRTPRGTVSVAPADLSMAMAFSRLAAKPISRYASQYGPNRVDIATATVPFAVTLAGTRCNDQTLQGWVNQIVSQNRLPSTTCVAILNPPGVVNTDADSSQGVGGYHSLANVPYLFVNVMGSGLTVQDDSGLYALALSHEIAEMVVDPRADLSNPEVCDACGPNCQIAWIDYFDSSGGYVATSQAFPPSFPYAFFINGMVRPESATACPAPAAACNYAPP